LQVFESIMSAPELTHLLLIVAYRSSEIEGPHPLHRFFETLKSRERPVSQIQLTPLELGDFEAFLQDSLLCGGMETKQLAGLIYKRTQGNPFFCKQLVCALYKD